jgi:hypothetical protein
MPELYWECRSFRSGHIRSQVNILFSGRYVSDSGFSELDALKYRNTSQGLFFAWKGADIFEKARRWALVGSPQTITAAHGDSGGYGTWVRVIEGRKLWFVVHNLDAATLNLWGGSLTLEVLKEIIKANPHRKIWAQYAYLEPGMIL